MAKKLTFPLIGSRWIWEIDNPDARALVEVVSCTWNGEEWWVETRTLMHNKNFPPNEDETIWNDLDRFWEACKPVLSKITGRTSEYKAMFNESKDGSES